MKKFFVSLILIILVIMAAIPYFAGMVFDLPSHISSSLYIISTLLNYILLSSAIAWMLGVIIGLLFGKLPFCNAIIAVTNSVSLIPAFILTAIIVQVLGFSFKNLILSLCIPLFFRAFADSATAYADFCNNNYTVHKLGLTSGLYFSQYTLPCFISPIFLSLIRILRSAIVSVAFVLFSGLLVKMDTTTFYILIFAALVAVVLLNTLCLIIPQSEGEKTWLKRL